jgi:hypothetical protein
MQLTVTFYFIFLQFYRYLILAYNVNVPLYRLNFWFTKIRRGVSQKGLVDIFWPVSRRLITPDFDGILIFVVYSQHSELSSDCHLFSLKYPYQY